MPDFEALGQSHPRLASLFQKYWDTPLADYASLLYQPAPSLTPIDPLFLEVFQTELLAQGYSIERVEEAAKQLQAKQTLQTSHHITPTHGPTFNTLDLQCLSGLSEEDTYLIGANSGVAFSNSAWSGALSYEGLPLETLIQEGAPLLKKSRAAQQERKNHGESEERISLIPAKLRDQLVYGEKIPSSVTEAYSQFTPDLQTLLTEPEEGASYSSFAAHSASKIQEKIYNRKVLIFDLNPVISKYLVKLEEQQPNHPLIKLLNSPARLKELCQSSGQEMTFLGSYQGKKSKKIEKFTFDGKTLIGQKTAAQDCNWAELCVKLKSGELCPGVLPLFLTLSFSLGIKCLGSFNQIEYLERIHQALGKMNLNWGIPLTKTPSLTTGRIAENFMPLSLAMQKQTISTNDYATKPMGFFWQYYLQKLSNES